ncbi:MAG TPA: SUMF1/EgtB/PvdO family nonheme iron enzyme, partial [Bacteroidales bacterium]|nr:SUMF1/EgtB/PvdO family nonheme iron enzyme [Bacteroidales bacterium]
QTGFRRVTVSSFYLSDHEVTNGEYREFTNWVRDSVCLSFLAKTDNSFYLNPANKTLNWEKRDEIFSEQNLKKLAPLFYAENEIFNNTIEFNQNNTVYITISDRDTFSVAIYPDTLCWVKNSLFSFLEDMTNVYFCHPAYSDYPVVGVSYYQALAYCDWRSKMLNYAVFKTINNNQALRFRLPTEAEWEYAANYFLPDIQYNLYNFPWASEYLIDENGNYLANFGAIFDQNSMLLKSYYEMNTSKKSGKNKVINWEFYLTSPVKLFPPNDKGLYDMAGNVAEWVMDIYIPSSFREFSVMDTLTNNKFLVQDPSLYDSNLFYITEEDNESEALKKLVDYHYLYNIEEKMDTVNGRNYWLTRARAEIHNAKVVKANPKARIIKGGSWNSGPAYLQCGSREIISDTKNSSHVGFRVCMTYQVEIKE